MTHTWTKEHAAWQQLFIIGFSRNSRASNPPANHPNRTVSAGRATRLPLYRRFVYNRGTADTSRSTPECIFSRVICFALTGAGGSNPSEAPAATNDAVSRSVCFSFALQGEGRGGEGSVSCGMYMYVYQKSSAHETGGLRTARRPQNVSQYVPLYLSGLTPSPKPRSAHIAFCRHVKPVTLNFGKSATPPAACCASSAGHKK